MQKNKIAKTVGVVRERERESKILKNKEKETWEIWQDKRPIGK